MIQQGCHKAFFSMVLHSTFQKEKLSRKLYNAEAFRILFHYLLEKYIYYHLRAIMLTPDIAQIVFYMNRKVFCHFVIYFCPKVRLSVVFLAEFWLRAP